MKIGQGRWAAYRLGAVDCGRILSRAESSGAGVVAVSGKMPGGGSVLTAELTEFARGRPGVPLLSKQGLRKRGEVVGDMSAKWRRKRTKKSRIGEPTRLFKCFSSN